MRSIVCVVSSLAIAIAVSGCATAIKGTTQRVAVFTVPPGAQCTLRNERAPAPVVVAATPAEAEVRRDGAPLELRCTKESHLDVAENYAPSFNDGMERTEAHKRQVLVADALLRQYQLAETAQTRVREEADAQRTQTNVAGAAASTAAVGLPVTVLATAAPTLGGGAVVAGAGLVAAPLFLGLVVALPFVIGVDLATGALYSYPMVLLSILPPTTFADERSRDAYFAGVDRHFAIAAQALRDDTKANCWLWCERRSTDDEAFIEEWRARVAGARARTKLASATAANPVEAK